MSDIKYARVCDECGETTFQFERCHECGDIPWKKTETVSKTTRTTHGDKQ